MINSHGTCKTNNIYSEVQNKFRIPSTTVKTKPPVNWTNSSPECKVGWKRLDVKVTIKLKVSESYDESSKG